MIGESRGKLVVFLTQRTATGACCNPNLTPEQVIELLHKVPWNHYPVCIKREGMGFVGVTLDAAYLEMPKEEELLDLLRKLEKIEFYPSR
jgi:PHD/YefM family antitoxin component YafN of YafNO toxin-antitoxin module